MLPRKSKRGVTLVEVVIGVVVLSIFSLGVLSLLVVGNQSVANSAADKALYSDAIQRLDTVITAVSNTALLTEAEIEAGTESFFQQEDDGSITLLPDKLHTQLGLGTDCRITVKDTTTDDLYDPDDPSTIRGWYIELTYQEKVTVSGFAAFTQGVFADDKTE